MFKLREMAMEKGNEYYNGVHYRELPEHKELMASLAALAAFQKAHETAYCNHLLQDQRWILEHKPFYLICGEHKRVFRENLSPAELVEYEAIFDRMGKANVAYLEIVRPGWLNKNR